MRKLRYILMILLATLMLTGICSAGDSGDVMRGVWVATVYQLDYPKDYSSSASELAAWTDNILDDVESMGFNAVFLQVRPCADAFYDSDIFPWSKYLSGEQGVSPDDSFDPLEYWIDEAHKRGIELHAWINPYRVAMSEADFESMAANHPAKENPDWVVHHTNGQYYFDPGIPEVRELIEDGVLEIVENYDVDGVHLDDYFYPDASFDDADTYEKYSDDEDIGDWRRKNVDSLIRELGEVVREKGGVFGVSPAGIWANYSDDMPDGSETRGNQTYFTSFADTRKWVKNEWIDYIVPQIYWNIGYDIADYKKLANWWADVVSGTDVTLYIGMADYKANEAESTSVWYGTDELRRQIELNESIAQISGEVHFSYSDIAENDTIHEFYEQIYGGKEPEPDIEWQEHSPYMEGANGEFLPDGELTRAQAATLISRVAHELDCDKFDENAEYKNEFNDVSESAWYGKYVGFMQKIGLIGGYPDGTFKPDKTITRAEFAAIIARLGDIKTSDKQFPDVPGSHWAYEAVGNAAARGLISGYPDGSFAPERTITRAECVKIMNRLLGRAPHKDIIDSEKDSNPFSDLKKSHWAYYEIIEASYNHKYFCEDGNEYWYSENMKYIGENGFIYLADDFEFFLPELNQTDPLTELNLNKVDSVALHHMEHATATFYDVERWHVKDNGWRAIGYNFWIGFDGTVYVGRGLNVGAGVGNHNSHVISVGFQGDYHGTETEMPKAQYEAGVKLLKWLATRVPTITQAGGHGAWNSTDCPGDKFPTKQMVNDAGLEYVPMQ